MIAPRLEYVLTVLCKNRHCMLLANYKLYCTLQYTVPTKYIVVYWLSTRRCTALFCTVLFAYNILNKIQHCIIYIQGFGSRTGRIRCFCLLWILIRIRFSNFSGSGPGFNPDPGTKKECRKGSKSDLSEENLKIMT